MRRKKTEFLVLIMFFIFLTIVSAQHATADGGVFIDVDYEEHVYIPNQKAAIFWDGINETMIISSKIQTENVNNFAWVTPIQSQTYPEVEEGDSYVFNEIAYAFPEYKESADVISYSPGNYLFPFLIGIIFWIFGIITMIYGVSNAKVTEGLIIGVVLLIFGNFFFIFGFFFSGGMVGSTSEGYDYVELLEIKTIDIYDIAILKSTNATQLVGWLNQNDFKVPNKAIPVLEDYCEQENFYFIVNKINLSNSSSETQTLRDLEEGVATPLKIKFQPETPFYPMKMTSINEGYTKINVYFISNSVYTDQSNILTFEKRNWETVGISSYFLDETTYEFETISMLTFEGDTEELTDDSYFTIDYNYY